MLDDSRSYQLVRRHYPLTLPEIAELEQDIQANITCVFFLLWLVQLPQRSKTVYSTRFKHGTFSYTVEENPPVFQEI